MSAPRRRRWWQAAAILVAAGLTVALTQNTTTAAFTGRTSDTANSVGTATTFCASPGGTTLGVTNDTAVYEQSPTTAYGGSATIGVSSGVGVHAHSLLRFTLPALATHCTITSATLRLYATSSQGPGWVDVYRASTTWASGTASWNMAARPGPAGTAVGFAEGTTGWQQWTVTTLVQELYAGTDYGFLLKDRVNNASPSRATLYESLDSGTVANRPQLVLTWG
jgi:hypothetical protein